VRAAAFKYGIKWVGNGVAKLGPFLLFMGGGWMIMARSISAGSSLRVVLQCDTLWFQWVFFDTRAIKSSILERNSFRIGDVFILL
jgi:hypothetical protein